MNFKNTIKRNAVRLPCITQGKWISHEVGQLLPKQLIAYIWLLSESIVTKDLHHSVYVKVFKLQNGCRVGVRYGEQKTMSHVLVNVHENYSLKIKREHKKQILYLAQESEVQLTACNPYMAFGITGKKGVYVDEELKSRLTLTQERSLTWLAYEAAWYYKYKTIKGVTSNANSIQYTFNQIRYRSTWVQVGIWQKGRTMEVIKEWLLNKKSKEHFQVEEVGEELWQVHRLSIAIFQQFIIISEYYDQEWMANEGERLHDEWLYKQYQAKNVSLEKENRNYYLEEGDYYELKFK